MFDPGMRDAIKMVLLDGLRQKGRTINEIEKARRIQGDPEVAAHANEPVWYDLDGLRRFVAKRLRMDEDSVVGRGRKSEHFMMITKQEISALRRAGTIKDWRAGSGRGVFRVAGRLPPPPPDSGISVKDRKYGRQLGRPTGDDDLHDSFILMLEGPMQETYKFALARAILDYCHENGGSPTPDYSIPYAYLAEKFLEYYWKLQWFGIRQNRRGKENRVFKAIRETFGDEKPESFQAARAFHRTQCDTVRGIILDNVFGHAKTRTSVVVHAFQKIRVSPYTVSDNVFYEPDDDKSRITMNTEALLFLNRNYDMLRSAVLLRWAVRLEELNPSMIKVMTKIAMEDIRRSDLDVGQENSREALRRLLLLQGMPQGERLARGTISYHGHTCWTTSCGTSCSRARSATAERAIRCRARRIWTGYARGTLSCVARLGQRSISTNTTTASCRACTACTNHAEGGNRAPLDRRSAIS